MEHINNFLQQCYVGPDGKMILIQDGTPMSPKHEMTPMNGMPTIREKNLIQKKFGNRSPTKMETTDQFARDDATD